MHADGGTRWGGFKHLVEGMPGGYSCPWSPPELRVYPQGLEKYVLASHSALPLSCQPVRAWLDAGSHKYIYHREGEQGQALSSRVIAETEPAGTALLLRPRGSWLPGCAIGLLMWSSVVCVTLVLSLFVGSLCTIQVSRQLAAHPLICLDTSSLESPSSTCPCSF